MVNVYTTTCRRLSESAIHNIPSLTVFGRSLLLITLEVAANVVCWAIVSRSRSILGLAVLAWTIGLRHALDADHIRSVSLIDSECSRILNWVNERLWIEQLNPPPSAIDNATRTLIGHGRLSITCGLFFSLGHSTIVIVVNIAIVISTSVYNKLAGVGNVGSIVGTSISAAFLLLVGLANSVILWRILRQRHRAKHKLDRENGNTAPKPLQNENMLMMRLLGPLVNFVDRPWKMYPVGVLFGLGFDTASSIALLAISALAKNSEGKTRMTPSEVIILPLLFTAGMTLVDSLDSILMLYSYSGFADRSWRIFEGMNSRSTAHNTETNQSAVSRTADPSPGEINAVAILPLGRSSDGPQMDDETSDNMTGEHESAASDGDRITQVKRRTMSKLSIVLTTMSILLAFSISVIETMGLIGTTCAKCQAAASAPGGGGLAGKWWRAWAVANNNSGYIGAAIVGAFVIIVSGWYVTGWGMKMIKRKLAE